MASLKDLRNRITSVKATQKITKAMQMVAAAKLRRAQNAAESGRPYAEKMASVLGNLAGKSADAAMEFEPSEEAILETLLPKNLTVQVYRALLENAASEQGARMSAMDSATRNAGEMIKKQTLIYNRTRQAMITKELIEIISGAEAL
jgi:F0F1-type ATP synthase gamma subunit